MLKIPMGPVAALSWSFCVLLGLGAEIALGGDHGYSYTVRVHQHGVPATGLVGVASYAPVATYAYYPTYATTTVATLAPANYLVSPTLTYQPVYAFSVAPPVATSGTAAPLLKSAANSAVVAANLGSASIDYLPLYNAFLQQEAVKHPATLLQAAGVRPHPADVAAFQQNHAQLVAVVGADRLASIGRFLLTRRADADFRDNAVKLFEPLLGVYLTQYVPLIDRFLDDLRQGPAPAHTPAPAQAPAPAQPPTELMPVPGPAMPPPPTNPNPVTVPPPSPFGLRQDPRTGHFVATDSHGIRTEFDASMKLLSVTKADGKVLRFDEPGTTTAAK
jgi:hypothetical protein